MLDQWLHRAERTTGVGRSLQAYLWWGLLIRGLLLAALIALLVVEGNFLAEWLLAWRVTPSVGADLEEYTIASYGALVAFLVAGVYGRWKVLQALRAVRNERNAPETPAEHPEAHDDEARDREGQGAK